MSAKSQNGKDICKISENIKNSKQSNRQMDQRPEWAPDKSQ